MGEGGAEVYSAATTRDEARIVFEDAKNMVKKSRSTLGRLFDFNKLAIYRGSRAHQNLNHCFGCKQLWMV